MLTFILLFTRLRLNKIFAAVLNCTAEDLLKVQSQTWNFQEGYNSIRLYLPLIRPRWLSWMRRQTGDQEVAGSTPAEVGNILSWRLIMKYFLRSFSLFADSTRVVVSLWWNNVHNSGLSCPVNVWLGKLTALDMTPLGWLGRKTSTQTNKTTDCSIVVWVLFVLCSCSLRGFCFRILFCSSLYNASYTTVNTRYNDRICSQRCCHYNGFAFCKESLMDRMICKKNLVLFLFPQRTYVLDIC